MERSERVWGLRDVKLRERLINRHGEGERAGQHEAYFPEDPGRRIVAWSGGGNLLPN